MNGEEVGTAIHRTPVDPKTGLATDFLNQYNEVTMILEMLVDMPDLFEEVAHWRPRSYAEHFRASGFHDLDNVIAAYAAAPPEFRGPFDTAVAHLNDILSAGLEIIGELVGSDDSEQLGRVVEDTHASALAVMERLNGIIHGATIARQDQIDAMLSSQDDIDSLFSSDTANSQADIDAVFASK